jgi:AraC-like DNA-binding protein
MSHYSRLCRARDYLAARFNERTSLADAAAHAGLSSFYFHRLFVDAF